VRSARGQRQRRSRGDSDEPPVRIEEVQQREQIVLARSAAVEEDESAFGLSSSGADAMGKELG
jgi:hypothetical protein